MRKIIFICTILCAIYSCKSVKMMTNSELEILNNGGADVPMRVLLITDKQDSLVLRKKSSDIDIKKNKANLQLLIDRLKITMNEAMGVGIAAPQVGINKNVFLFTRIDKPDYPVEAVINPRIVAHSEEEVCFEGDGCLSIPDLSGNSKRWAWVEVEYYDIDNNLIRERIEGYSRKDGFTGVIFQHEYDHLQGVLFIDKLCDE